MVRRQHSITVVLALTCALAVAAPASARFDLNPSPAKVSAVVHASTCSEVCSGNGYGVHTNMCSEVCSGNGYGLTAARSDPSAELGAKLPHDPRPRSVALSAAAS